MALDPYWLDHVIQLTKKIYKMDCLVAKVLKSFCLLFIEVLHLEGSYNLIVVQIDDFEPVTERLGCGFIFFAKHKVHEVLIAHFAFDFGPEFTWHLLEDSINCLPRKGVTFIL